MIFAFVVVVRLAPVPADPEQKRDPFRPRLSYPSGGVRKFLPKRGYPKLKPLAGETSL